MNLLVYTVVVVVDAHLLVQLFLQLVRVLVPRQFFLLADIFLAVLIGTTVHCVVHNFLLDR